MAQEPAPPGVPFNPSVSALAPPSLSISAPPTFPKVHVTLIVKHVPSNLATSTVQEIFKSVGAANVRPCNAEGKLRGVVFVDFLDTGQAARARDQLHGLKILNKTLAAEFAHPPKAASASDVLPLLSRAPSTNDDLGGPKPPEDNAPKEGPTFESIAPTLKLDYPFPPYLRYSYPPPDASVLHNIQSALVAVPRFYTQVLHLMNKMNLPPPFTSIFPPGPSPAIPPPPQSDAPTPPPPVESALQRQDDVTTTVLTSYVPPPTVSAAQASVPPQNPGSIEAAAQAERDHGEGLETETESESELESEEDGELSSKKRRKKRPLEHRKKRRREPTLDMAGVREVPVTEAGGYREVRQRVKKTTLQIKLDVPAITARTAKLPVPQVKKPRVASPKPQTPTTETTTQAQAATREELKAGQLPPAEFSANAVFKNYARGEPTQVLYVKNIAKDVTVGDMEHVFGSFLGGRGASEAIRLMQEGRMKGQAFVTFADESAAEAALGFTHGFLLKGKPLIVQFGRKAKSG